jgi:1-acyl-sn-glycerol-3-phosphate acyltransferase
LRHAGIITLEFLPAIAPGMNRKLLMSELESRVETTTRALEAAALARFPQLPKPSVDKPSEAGASPL